MKNHTQKNLMKFDLIKIITLSTFVSAAFFYVWLKGLSFCIVIQVYLFHLSGLSNSVVSEAYPIWLFNTLPAQLFTGLSSYQTSFIMAETFFVSIHIQVSWPIQLHTGL